MPRKANADYVPLMIDATVRRLLAGDEVSIADVAKEFGVSKALVHFYFGDRQSLIDAAWQSVFMAFVDDDQRNVEDFAAADDWNGVNKLVADVFSRARDAVHLTHVRAAAEAQRSEALAEVLAGSTANTVASWKQMLDSHIEIGAARTPLDTEALALLFASVPMGVTVMAPDLTDGQRAAVAHAWATMIRAVLEPGFELPGA